MSKPLLTRVPNHFAKTLTFDGTSVGDVGTDAIATVTGRVLITHMTGFCSTLLVGSGATIELGTANNTGELIAQTTAENLDANEFWNDATPEAEASNAVTDKTVAANIILTVGTAAVTAGVLEITMYWLPLSTDGQLG